MPGDVSLTARLKQGATLIREDVIADVPDAWTTFEYVLSAAEAGAITDYGALEVELVADGGALSYAQEVLADNPVSYWRLGNEVTIHDEMGVSPDVTATGGWTNPGLLAGDADAAVLFDGADEPGSCSRTRRPTPPAPGRSKSGCKR